jgi:hypothetical protein
VIGVFAAEGQVSKACLDVEESLSQETRLVDEFEDLMQAHQNKKRTMLRAIQKAMFQAVQRGK